MSKAKKMPYAEDETGFSEIMKRFKEHPFVFGGTVVLLVFIIIAFVFVPTLPSIQKDGDNVVFGYYNGKPIEQNAKFINILRETANMMDFDLQSDYGMNYSMAMQVWYQAFIRTFINIAVLDEMKTSGYKAPADEIDRLVASNPIFQEDGLFSIVKYNNYGKSRQLALWHSTEEEYITGKFFNDLMGLKTSAAEKKFIGAMAYPERTFEMVSIPRTAYPEQELQLFGAARQELFRTIHLSRITMSSEKEAGQLLESIQSGRTTFEDAARVHSTDMDSSKGGDMGRRMAYEIFSELQEETDRNMVTALRKGEYSKVLKGSFDSWVFYRAEDNPYNTDILQPENMEKIRSYLDRFEGGRIENWLVTFMEELLAGAKQQNMGLTEYIMSLKDQENNDLPARFHSLENVVLNTVGPFSLNYNSMGGAASERGLQLFTSTLSVDLHPELYGAASSEVFWRNAFLTPLNNPSPPFSLGSSILILTPVEENSGDETSVENIANFYQWGYMYNAMGMDVNESFMTSDKFENNFYDIFMPMIFAGNNG